MKRFILALALASVPLIARAQDAAPDALPVTIAPAENMPPDNAENAPADPAPADPAPADPAPADVAPTAPPAGASPAAAPPAPDQPAAQPPAGASAAANTPIETTAVPATAGGSPAAIQANTAPRLPYEVPQQRISPVADHRPRPQRPNDWQRKQAELEQSVRDSMSKSGFTDPALQNIILAHIKSESRARAPLRERGRRLYRGLNSPKVNDAEMALALGGYITALEADRARRIAAEEALDAKIGWSKNPRLHSMLLLFGVIGESPITLPLRSFNQPPRAFPRTDDKGAAGTPAATTPIQTPIAPPPAAPAPPAQTPMTVVPLGDPPTTDAMDED